MVEKNKKVYAIRGGPSSGVYDTWADAQRAGFSQRMSLGDACKLEGAPDDVDMRAEAFMSVSPVSNRFAEYQAWLKHQPFAIRLFAFVILSNVIFIGTFQFVVWLSNSLGCQSALLSTTGTCKGLLGLQMFVSDRMDYLIQVFISEIIGLLAFAVAFLVGVINI